MSFDGSRAEYYRQRAAEVRSLADRCSDHTIKAQFAKIAEEYERLATSVARGLLRP